MKSFPGKVAVITADASGVGFGMAHAFAQAGMKIVIADIRTEMLERAKAGLEQLGAAVLAVQLARSRRLRCCVRSRGGRSE